MLPSPTSQRFQPLRSGLINLFKYQVQEFWYERGRLLIRGNNGSGKSRVLALQLPFLLDGEISPRRVEPDGDPARQIAWHLLMDEYEQRTGYTWIEFGRLDENGCKHFVTLGCGMRAIRGGDNQPTRWFFVTEYRAGQDFDLLQGTHPLSAERLAEVIGPECLYKSAREYRLAVDKRLFAVGEERYKALIELLIRLRAPQLAKKLNAELLFSALSDALPPLPTTVVENVAAAFKDLDNLREQHETLKSLSRALAAFHAGYQGYLQTALLRRAAVLRSRHSEYESAQREVNSLERNLEAAKIAEETAQLIVNESKAAFTIADAHFQTLQQSSGAEDVQTLDYAQQTAFAEKQRADEAHKTAQDAIDRQVSINSDLERSFTSSEQCLAALTTVSRDASALAVPAGFANDHRQIFPDIAAWPTNSNEFAKLKSEYFTAAGNHDHRLKQIDAGLASIGELSKELAAFQSREDQLSARISKISEDIQVHDKTARDHVIGLAEKYGIWHATLRWLQPPPWSDLSSSFDDWIESADDSHRKLAQAIEKSARLESIAFANASAEIKNRQTTLATERRGLMDERDALAEGSPPRPSPPPTRAPDARIDRIGAPLWQVCEFRPELTDTQRAGLEAALEASGLLDAWISPDGSLTGDLPADTFLAPSAGAPRIPQGPTLADWLQPDMRADSSSGLDPTTLLAVLSCIHAGQSDEKPHWVSMDGRWQLGPAFGRGQKSTAIYLGSTGREAARLRRLSELEAALSNLDLLKADLDAEEAQLAVREVEADAERNSAPTDHQIARCLTLRAEARRQLNETELDHATAVQITYRARKALQTAENKLHKDARDLGYGEHLDRLAELRSSWSPYTQVITQLWGDAQAWMTAAHQTERLTAQKSLADEEVLQTSERAGAAQSDSVRSAEIYRTLSQNLGASVEEYQIKLQKARAAREDAQSAVNQANDAQNRAAQIRAGLDASLEPTKARVTEADQRRHTAITELRIPLLHGLFPEAHPDLSDIETDEWAASRAYAIARRLDKDLPSTDLSDSAWTDRLNALDTQINDLRNLTGALGCQVVSHILGEGLTVVNCHYQGSPLTPAHCLAAVERERETHERLLSDGERAIIDRHLVTEVSLQLQTLIGNARFRTEEMNAEMTRCATTLGVTLRLVWEPVSEGLPAGLPHVRKLLLADHAAWSEEERSTVGRFLHQMIQEERARDPAAPGTEQLQRALDYRRWHAFAADRRQNNRWERLTRKRYGTGSGGEKALMLTIPQMAAASSHYKNAAPHAPRLILLDEAFAGMDRPTRARCMGLLEAFDLDLLMTSEREFGAHATISGIAIYQLVADAEAISATRWVWNGHKNQLAPVPDTPELCAEDTTQE